MVPVILYVVIYEVMTKERLKKALRFQLGTFNSDDSVMITNYTVHKDILVHGTHYKRAPKLYKEIIESTLKLQSYELVEWPANWLDLTVQELTDAIYVEDI
jgi:hypothetical protein